MNEFLLFLIVIMATFIALIWVVTAADGAAERAAWRGKQRYIVRQVQNGVVVKEWTCARYRQHEAKISFCQENHKVATVVAGQWHVEPA